VREGPFRRNFGRAVKAARESRGFTQRELAEAARIADKYLSRIELGMATPSVYVASRLAQALGVSVDALIASSPKLADQELASVLRMLNALEPSEIERVRRILLEVLR
jgi:transcriptional regulator with XRE-family HTH domain